MRFVRNRGAFVLLSVVASPWLIGDPLLTNVNADISVPGLWTYTVFNDEPDGSPNYIDSFSLLINAPITVTGTPPGWAVDTDDLTFVFWFNTDPVLPYPHDIAPGSSLTGFSISSAGALSMLNTISVASWDHTQDVPGPLSDTLLVSSPSVVATVPEPSLTILVTSAMLVLWRINVRHRNR